MAYDATKPTDDDYLSAFPAEMREQLRAIIQDAIVNAMTVNGYSPGNLNGNIPVSNGNLNANLNADKLDGHDATYFSADGHVHAAATQSTNGFMSNTDKTKVDGIATGAEVNQNAFSNVAVGSTTIQADNKTDTLTLAAGANIAITPDATNDKVTVAVTGTVPTAAAADRATADAAGNVITDTYFKKSGGTIAGNINWTGELRVCNSNLNCGYFSSDTATGIYDFKNDRTVMYYVQDRNTIGIGNGSAVTSFTGTVHATLDSTSTLAGTADNATHAGTADNATHAGTADNADGINIVAGNEIKLRGSSNYAGIIYFGYDAPAKVNEYKFCDGTKTGGLAHLIAASFSGALHGTADNASTLNGYTAAQLVGEVSHATNGYHKFPGGTIVQWGTGSTTAGWSTKTSFPIVFPSAVSSITITPKNPNGTSAYADTVGVKAYDLAGFYGGLARTAAANNFFWLAIGY